MHLFFATRGEQSHVRRFLENLQYQHFPWKIKNQKGKVETSIVQGHLQPIQLWSYVFPEEHLDIVLRTLHPGKHKGKEKYLAVLRKILGAKKIPKWNPKGNVLPQYHHFVDVVGIGIRKDNYNKYGNEQL